MCVAGDSYEAWVVVKCCGVYVGGDRSGGSEGLDGEQRVVMITAQVLDNEIESSK